MQRFAGKHQRIEWIAITGQGAVQDSWGEAPRQQPRRRAEKSVLQKVADSSAFKQFARSAGREIVRSIFGTGRRR